MSEGSPPSRRLTTSRLIVFSVITTVGVLLWSGSAQSQDLTLCVVGSGGPAANCGMLSCDETPASFAAALARAEEFISQSGPGHVVLCSPFDGQLTEPLVFDNTGGRGSLSEGLPSNFCRPCLSAEAHRPTNPKPPINYSKPLTG